MKKLPTEHIEIQNLELLELLKNWAVWLNKRYRPSTIRGFIGDTSHYIKWCEAENIHPYKTTYPELLSFVQVETAAGKAKGTVKQKLVAIKQFYNYLIETKQRDENPASELLIRNETRKLPPDILKYEVLEKLYYDYPAKGIVGKRNKAILGLLVYQGINTGELQALEVKDVKTAEGKIYIPAVYRGNDRILKLEAHQIVQLQNYILQIRPVIMAMNEHSSDKLFFSSGSSSQLSNSFTRMLKIMRTVYPALKNMQQIRASMIAHWYTIHNTRQVQYMAGHRYVSSTERYRGDKLEGLQEQLEKLHPIQ